MSQPQHPNAAAYAQYRAQLAARYAVPQTPQGRPAQGPAQAHHPQPQCVQQQAQAQAQYMQLQARLRAEQAAVAPHTGWSLPTSYYHPAEPGASKWFQKKK